MLRGIVRVLVLVVVATRGRLHRYAQHKKRSTTTRWRRGVVVSGVRQ